MRPAPDSGRPCRPAGSWSTAHVRVSSETIVGRDAPLRLLAELLERAAGGEAAIALVSGEAGWGRPGSPRPRPPARAEGLLVLRGECLEFGGEEFPYAPVVASLRELSGDWPGVALPELAALLPTRAVPASEPASTRYGQGRLSELLLAGLGRLARERGPLVVVLEDIHWADRSPSAWSSSSRATCARAGRARPHVPDRGARRRPSAAALRGRARPAPDRHAHRARAARPRDVAQQLEAIAGRPGRATASRAGSMRSPAATRSSSRSCSRRAGKHIPATLSEAVAARLSRLSPAACGRARHLRRRRRPRRPRLLARRGAGRRPGRGAARGARRRPPRPGRQVALRHGLIGEVVYGELAPTSARACTPGSRARWPITAHPPPSSPTTGTARASESPRSRPR